MSGGLTTNVTAFVNRPSANYAPGRFQVPILPMATMADTYKFLTE